MAKKIVKKVEEPVIPECACKYNKLKTDNDEYAIICNEWNCGRNCDKCGFNPMVAELRLLRKFPAKEVFAALKVSYENSVTNPNYTIPIWDS